MVSVQAILLVFRGERQSDEVIVELLRRGQKSWVQGVGRGQEA